MTLDVRSLDSADGDVLAVFRIVEVDLAYPTYPFGSALISDGRTSGEFDCRCRSYSKPRDYFVQGFSDLRDDDWSKPAFLGAELRLVTSWANTLKLVAELSGAVPVRVGYKQWDQERLLPEAEWFTTAPLLGGIYADALCMNYRINGAQPNRCKTCRRPSKVHLLSSDKISLSQRAMPATDVCRLGGTFVTDGTLITNVGLAKLEALGYRNLIVKKCTLYE